MVLCRTLWRKSVIAIHCVAAEHGDNKKIKNKERWVKLKAFPTNVGRHNNIWQCAAELMIILKIFPKRAISAISEDLSVFWPNLYRLSVCHVHISCIFSSLWPRFPKRNNNWAIRRRFQEFFTIQIKKLPSGIFDLMNLIYHMLHSMYHMWPYALQAYPNLHKLIILSVYDLHIFTANADLWPIDLERLWCVGCHVIIVKLYTKFE